MKTIMWAMAAVAMVSAVSDGAWAQSSSSRTRDMFGHDLAQPMRVVDRGTPLFTFSVTGVLPADDPKNRSAIGHYGSTVSWAVKVDLSTFPEPPRGAAESRRPIRRFDKTFTDVHFTPDEYPYTLRPNEDVLRVTMVGLYVPGTDWRCLPQMASTPSLAPVPRPDSAACVAYVGAAVFGLFRAALDEAAKEPERKAVRCRVFGVHGKDMIGECGLVDVRTGEWLWNFHDILVHNGAAFVNVAHRADLHELAALARAHRRGMWAIER